MQKWLLTIIIAILPVITACSKTDTEASVPEEETGKKTEIKFLQLNLWADSIRSDSSQTASILFTSVIGAGSLSQLTLPSLYPRG
jgi:hypothetical protein